jgi:hypothetical protein
MEPHSTKDLSVNDRSIHRLSAVKLSACENMGPGAPNSMEEDMPDALKRRAGSLLFESPDARLAAELAEDIPSTMHKPPPRKQRRWGNSQAGSSSGKSAEAMTGGLIPFVGPSDITGTSGLGNPASSKAVSQSDASSEADHTVKALFPATSEETRLVIPRAAERVIHSTVLPTQERSPLEPRDGAPPVGKLEGVTSDQRDQSGKTHGKHGDKDGNQRDQSGKPPQNCEFFEVGSKEEDAEDARNELQEMRRELQAGKETAENQGKLQHLELSRLRVQLAEVTRSAQEQNRLAANARLEVEALVQQARVDRESMRVNAHDLASNMRLTADAETVNRLSLLNKERDAEVERLAVNYHLSATNLELHQAETLAELRSEMTAKHAVSLNNLEVKADLEYSRRNLVTKAEHDEKVRRAENLEAAAIAQSQDRELSSSHDEGVMSLMRKEHHAILLAQSARHAAVLQGKEEEAAHNAAEAQHAAALALQKSEQVSADIETNWRNSTKHWYDEHTQKQALNQVQTDREAKRGLDAQAQAFQESVTQRESVIAGLQHEMKARDSLNAALTLSKTTEIEHLLENARVMQYRLDVMAAAAPLHPVQVMVPQSPLGPRPRLRTGEVISDGSGPPPNDGGGGAPSGSGNGNNHSGSGPPGPGGNPGGGTPGPPGPGGNPVPPYDTVTPRRGDDRNPGGGPGGGRGPDPPAGPPHGPPHESEDDDDTRRAKKVTGTIDLGKLPTPGGFHLWRSVVRDEVSAVYADTQAAFRYVLELEGPEATLESMGRFPKDLTQLDAKLTKAINLMMLGLTTDLAKRLFNLKESYIKHNGQKIKGRQLMWVIYQFFAVDPASGVLFGVEDLLEVTLSNNGLAEFLAEWDRTLIHMTDPPPEALRDALFIKQVKGCSKLKTEWDNYYKAPIGSETRSFEYLHNSAMQVVERERFEHARKQITGKGRDAMAAPGGKKGDGKGKGKGKGTSSTNADGTPWYMNGTIDTRADRPCSYAAAGNCKLGDKCPWMHTPDVKSRKPGKGTDVAAAPSGGPAPNKDRSNICRWFRDEGSCRFGKDCTFCT